MSKSSCKCKEVECEECPEWIFTLADLIMCMMGLFVILWVLKPGMTTPPAPTQAGAPPEVTDFSMDLLEMSHGFGGVELNPNSTDPVEQAAIRRRKRQQ